MSLFDWLPPELDYRMRRRVGNREQVRNERDAWRERHRERERKTQRKRETKRKRKRETERLGTERIARQELSSCSVFISLNIHTFYH